MLNNKQLPHDILTTFVLSFILNIALVWISLPEQSKFNIDIFIHRPFWTGTLILFLIFTIFYFLRKSWYFILLAFFVLSSMILGIISSVKMDKRSEPLLLQDFLLFKESLNIGINYLTKGQIFIMIMGILIFIAIIFLFIKRKWEPITPLRDRILISIISVVLLIGLGNIRDDKYWNILGVTNKISNPVENLKVNGFTMGNFLQIAKIYQQKPSGYTVRKAEKLINEIETNSLSLSNSEAVNDGEKPNLIFIQLEAFFDPTTLPNVQFSEDPIPYFRSLQERFTGGNLGVNVYGAGTANTEFEVLTSMSIQMLQEGTTPFVSKVKHPMDSVAHQFKKLGYQTSGMHNNVGWFYKREKVYPRLGIDYTVFMDDMKNFEPVYDVPVPKDYELFKKITNRTSKTKEPDFLLGVTMELHGPYYLWSGHDIKVTSEMLPQEHVDTLEEYAYKINEVDKAVKELVTYYENSTEPTMIVFYSDHLPWLGDGKEIYHETGYIDKSETSGNWDKMYSTPFLIWDNYRDKPKENIDIGSIFLVPYIYSELNIKGNALDLFLTEQMKNGITQLRPQMYRDQDGWTPDLIKKYSYLHYYYLTEPLS